MIQDRGMDFTEGPKVITATTVFTGVMDAKPGAPATDVSGKDWGAGEKLVPMVNVGIADFNTLTSIQFDVIAADNDALTTNPVTLSTKTILLAALKKDTLHKLPPLASGSTKRFIGGKATIAGSAPSAGSSLEFYLEPIDGVPENVVNP